MWISGTTPSKKPIEKQQIFVNRFGYRFTLDAFHSINLRDFNPFAFGERDFTFLDFGRWQIGRNCEAMAIPKEIVEEEIRILNASIARLESDLSSPTIDATEKNNTMNLITAKTGLLTVEKQRLYLLEQQGKFHHIFPLLFPNLLDVTNCPITLDISSSPILVIQIRKVRVDGYYCSVVVQCSRKRVSRTNNPSYVIRSISCCFHPNR